MNFQGDLKSNFNTDGRTDGLRSTPHLPYGSNLPNAHEQNGIRDEFVTIGAVLADGLPWPTGERHPVIRSGERDEIPAHVRAAVWYRDEGRCNKTVRCQRHGYSKRCRVVRRYEQQVLAEVRDGIEFANWHEQEPITHASVIAYCAHCNAPGLTDRPL